MDMLAMLNLLDLEDLPPKEQELAEIIGMEAYRQMVYYYGGASVYIPKTETLIVAKRDEIIRREYDGDNIFALSRKWGLSERHVSRIVEDKIHELKKGQVDCQQKLF